MTHAADSNPLATPSRIRRAAPWLAIVLILIATTIALRIEGRIWWCDCRQVRPWITDVWTSHCSQHLSDPYSITHFSHGLIFCGLLAWLAPRWAVAWRLCTAIAIAAAWEVLENSPIIIDRYRSVTMSLDYLGDSAVNAVGDVGFCALGFLFARRFGLRIALGFFIASEIALLILIRDNLTLNVLMLIHPVEAIKAWQSVGHVPA